MSPDRQSTTLFWLQVGLYLSVMVFLLSTMLLLWFFVISQIRAMEEDRVRNRAMLQQHQTELQQHTEAMQDHASAREQHALAFKAMLERLAH